MSMRQIQSFIRLAFGAIVLITFLGACSPQSPVSLSTSPSGKTLQSQAQRIADPQSPPEDLAALVAGNSAFALDFFQAIREQDGNLFFSPYSLSSALAMTYAGARSNTAQQMAQVLHFELPQERLHPAYNALDLQLNQSQQSTDKTDRQPFQLNVANSIWGQKDYSFEAAFLDLLAQNYGAGLRLVDFNASPDGSRKEINDWVSRQTQQKIQDLIPQGGITPDTRLVLANAIYFKADWMYPFAKENTRDLPFNLLDGTQVQVPMMSLDKAKYLPYLGGNGFQAVELPYSGNQVSMVILVPDAGRFEEFQANLDMDRFDQILAGLQEVQLQVIFPKVSFTSSYQLADILSGMGMPDAFDPGEADFSGMNPDKSLFIGQVYHKAFVAVDEKGTEAAAASAVVMMESSAQLEPPQILVVDRPYIFLIRHKPSNTILFMGRVLDPRSDS